MAFEYEELSQDERDAIVKAHLRDLESQHLQIAVRVDAPTVGASASDSDKDNLAQLEQGITDMRAMLIPTDPPA